MFVTLIKTGVDVLYNRFEQFNFLNIKMKESYGQTHLMEAFFKS